MGYVSELRAKPFKAYYDESMDTLGIVLPPQGNSSIAHLATFTVTKSGWLTNIADNVFQNLKKDYPKLMWTVNQNDENLTWFFDKADGSVAKDGEVLFWYGIESVAEVSELMKEFTQQGRKMFGDINLESQLHRAANAASRIRETANAQRAERAERAAASYHTSAHPSSGRRINARGTNGLSSRSKRAGIEARAANVLARGYATSTNPNPPFGNKQKSRDWPAKVALIGARGYTGQALIDLLNNHPNMDLRHGVCKPFVDAIDAAGKEDAVIVDLSADYRFDDSWTYGLPELVDRSKIANATRISNPGCYATAAQIGIAPILDFIGAEPTVFGVSGYSGAGTKPSPKNDVKNLTNNIIPYSLTDHIHEREISRQLGTPVGFVPHVAVWFQGIPHTINIPLKQEMKSRDIRQLYQDRYAGEKLIKVVGESPLVKNIAGKHGVEVGGFAVHSSGKRVIVNATIDNLLKGAATQCLQNMNLALGYGEYEGIPLD